MKLNGIRDLLLFLNFLKDRSISYRIEHMRADSVMVTLTLVGIRIEVDFFDNHVEYSTFTGDERALDDQTRLFKLLNKDI